MRRPTLVALAVALALLATRSPDSLADPVQAGASAASAAVSAAETARAGKRGAEQAPNVSAEQRKIARFVASKYRLAVDEVQRFVVHAYQAAREFRIDPLLVLAIVSIESSFDPNARSPKGAQGLMQVLTRVHADKFKPFGGARAAFDPAANLKVGSQILKDYLVREGSVEQALKSYVGAARLPHDFGYSRKVLGERERLAQAAKAGPSKTAPGAPKQPAQMLASAEETRVGAPRADARSSN